MEPNLVITFANAAQRIAGAVALREYVCTGAILRKMAGMIPDDVPPVVFLIVREIAVQIVEHACEPPAVLDPSWLLLMCRVSSAPVLRTYLEAMAVSVETSSFRSPSQRVRRAVQFIVANCCHANLRLSDVAQAVRLSPWHMDRRLKCETGMSFVSHVRSRRLEVAKVRLADVTLSIKEIAYLARFRSLRTFNRQFRQECGVSPSAWRSAVPSGVQRRSS